MKGKVRRASEEGAEHGSDRQFMRVWGRILRYLQNQSKYLFLCLVMAFVGSVISVIGPDMISDITDYIQEGLKGQMPIDDIFNVGKVLVILFVIGALVSFVENYVMASISYNFARHLRRDLAEKINKVPLNYFDRTSQGDVLSRITNDADTVGSSLGDSLGTFVSSATLFIGSLVMMVYTNWIMAAAAIISTLAGFVLISAIMSHSQKYFNRQQDYLGKMNGFVEETYSGYKIVRSYNGEGSAKKSFDGINGDLYKSGYKSQFLSGLMQPLMGFIGNLGYVVVCIVGAVLVIKGNITIGVIVAFMMYVRLFTSPLTEMAQAFTLMQSAAAAGGRVFEFLDLEEMEDESHKTAKLENVKGAVEFRDVHFGYIPGKEIIHGFSLNVKPGQKVAIVGPTGAGKTTMVNLLMRFYDVDSGEILIDGVPIQQVPRSVVHDQFCMVLQDSWLFEGTVRENICFNLGDVSDERLTKACKAAGIYHFIESLPDGFDTVLKGDSEMSYGQKQQLTIARAMVKDAPLLILDEATSSVDTRTEKIIQQAMDTLSADRTSFVIAHRLSTIENADVILVMKDGNVIEQGTHKGLLEAGGFYADLYKSQFEGPTI